MYVHVRFTFLYIFWWARVCWPLLYLCRPFVIFEGCLDSNPESRRRKQASYQHSHPFPYNTMHISYHSGSSQLATMLDPGTLTHLGDLPLPGTLTVESHWGVFTEESSLRSPHWGVRTEESSLRSPHWGVLTEESSRRSPHWGFLTEDSSLRSPHGGVLTDESSRMSPHGWVLTEESSRRSPHWGVLTEDSSLRIPHWGFLTEESS